MNAATVSRHASPSAAACLANSLTFSSFEVVKNELEPSGSAVAVGSSVFRYSTPRAVSSGSSCS